MLIIYNHEGTCFGVRLIRKGEKWGLNDCLTHDREDPLVEIIDLDVDRTKFPDGQHVSYYGRSTLLERGELVGLDMLGYEPKWKLDGAAFAQVYRWLRRPSGGAK